MSLKTISQFKKESNDNGLTIYRIRQLLKSGEVKNYGTKHKAKFHNEDMLERLGYEKKNKENKEDK